MPARSRGDAFNIASHLPRVARDMPDRPAVVVHIGRDEKGGAVYRSRSIAELETLSNRYADGLTGAGFGRGMRVLLMVRPGFDFIALVFALFKIGAVPVMIDPGMGVGRMLECIRMVDLQGFIGIPAAQVMRVLRRGVFRSVRHVVTVGRRWAWGGTSLRRIAHGASEHFETVATAPTDTAAILFTSGSTGPAKGVVYEHAMFDAQIRAIQGSYGIKPGEIDLPAFPLFALFSVAMGMTSVIPQMDPSRPATVDPAKIVEAIIDHQVTNSFGSPAIWRRVADYCVERHIRLPSLNRILIAGAPVPYPVIEKL
ncbi:MAG: AMP-binding protein, partial [Phycisphaerae bacterium]